MVSTLSDLACNSYLKKKNMWGYRLLCIMLLHFRVIFSVSSVKLCSPEESFALLQFKNTISMDASASVIAMLLLLTLRQSPGIKMVIVVRGMA